MLGLKRGTVQLVPHQERWASDFEKEREVLQKIFGEDALSIQHVGSTAIPGIPAKPIIDISVSVKDFSVIEKYLETLASQGYQLKQDDLRTDRRFFTKGPESCRTHYLHVGEEGGSYVRDKILFRDFLRKHPEVAQEYADLKSRLGRVHSNDRYTYTEKKTDFIKNVLQRVG